MVKNSSLGNGERRRRLQAAMVMVGGKGCDGGGRGDGEKEERWWGWERITGGKGEDEEELLVRCGDHRGPSPSIYNAELNEDREEEVDPYPFAEISP